MKLSKSKDSVTEAQAITPGDNQRIQFTATSTVSAALAGDTNLIRLFPTTDCWIRLGLNNSVVAAPNDGRSVFCPAGEFSFLGTTINLIQLATHIAVIRDSMDGVLHLCEAD